MIRLGCAVAVTGLVALTAGACGGGTGGSGGSPASPRAATTSAGPTVLSGTRLAGLLLPAAEMPKGFTLDPDQTRNSMEQSAPPSAEPVTAGKVCELFTETAWIRTAGIGAATFAQSDFADAGRSQEIAQEIDGFHPGEGRRVMAALRTALRGCASFTYHQSGMTIKTRLVTRSLPAVADEGFAAVSTSPTFAGGTTLAAIRTGDTVVTVLYSSRHADKGAPAVTYAMRIADRVRSAG